MSVDLAKAVGHEGQTTAVSWTRRDLLLYAVGIGATAKDLRYVDELDPEFAAFPTYPVVLSFKGSNQDVVDFRKLLRSEPVPGLPNFNPNRVVHASQYLEILKPLPVESTSGWQVKRRTVGVHENKTGIIVDSELLVVDPEGTPYARMVSSTFNVGAHTTASGSHKFSKAITSAPVGKVPTDRKPDWIVTETTSPDQAILYRLSGDYNPLHIEPAIGEAAGFGGVILHGLATYGFAARAIVGKVAGDDPAALKSIGVRFTSPVKPGDTLETSIWEVGKEADGATRLAFVTKDLDTGKVVLGNGSAVIKKSEKSKL